MDEYIGPVSWPIRLPGGAVSEFDLHYTERGTDEGRERFVVATKGSLRDPVLLRVESSCVFGHVLDGAKCDCGDQLRTAFRRIHDHGSGMVIYALDEDARGHGIRTHFEMYVLRQHHGMDTEAVHEELDLPVDARTYSYVGPILDHFDVSEAVLMTNNSNRVELIEDLSVTVVERRPLEATVTKHNEQLLRAEKRDLGYEASYHDHDHWVNQLRSEDGTQFLLVDSYCEPLVSGELGQISSEIIPKSNTFQVLYATERLGGETLAELGRAGLDKVVIIGSDEQVNPGAAEGDLKVERYTMR